MALTEAQDPMTGFKTLEQAFRNGWRMKRVPFTEGLFFEKDIALGAERFTYANLVKLKVQQIVVLNGNEPLNGLPCFGLFYGTLESLRGAGLTIPFVKLCLEQFYKDLHKTYCREFYIEALVEVDNFPSIAICKHLFGEPAETATDSNTGQTNHVWQYKVSR
jgi:hypothetical protein